MEGRSRQRCQARHPRAPLLPGRGCVQTWNQPREQLQITTENKRVSALKMAHRIASLEMVPAQEQHSEWAAVTSAIQTPNRWHL